MQPSRNSLVPGVSCGNPALPAGTRNATNAFFATNLRYANLFRFRTEDGVIEYCCALEDSVPKPRSILRIGPIA